MAHSKYVEDIDAIVEAGKASREALDYARASAKEDMKLIDLSREIERFITDRGFAFAFPVNLSINDEAAHYTPKADDDKMFRVGDVLKIDIGARKNDNLVDCAITVDPSNKHAKLVEACDFALEAAISKVKAGVELRDIGKTVEEISKERRVIPIRNLGGHGIVAGELHADIFIPNFDNGDATRLQEGQVIAVEVFITDGKDGYVKEGKDVEIFRKFGGYGQIRNSDSRKIADFIDRNYGTYPFALRWLMEGFESEFKVRAALNDMMRNELLESYPILIEKSGGMVAQSEKTLIVEKDSCTVLT